MQNLLCHSITTMQLYQAAEVRTVYTVSQN